MSRIVLMDFDGTLTRRDTTLWLIRELLVTDLFKAPKVFLYLLQMLWSRRQNPDQLQKAKCRCVGYLLRGKSNDSIEHALNRFRHRVGQAFRQDVIDRLREYRNTGDQVIIVTASPAFAVAHALDQPGVSVIGTRYKNDNGLFSGDLDGNPCFGAEKTVRVNAWLLNAGVTWDSISDGWGDSPSDWHLMKLCKQRYWIADSPENKNRLLELDPAGQFFLKNEL